MTGLHTIVMALALTGAGAEEPILLDFSATWCGPCRQMDPVIEQLIAQGYRVRKVDFDRDSDLVRKYGIKQIPCFVMTVNGRETARDLGVIPAEKLVRMFTDAQRLVRPRVLPGPGGVPTQNVPTPWASHPKPAVRTIPLPAKHVGTALAMESRPVAQPGQTHSLNNGGSGRVQAAIAYASIPATETPVTNDQLIAATVRLRVHDDIGPGCGTGTIIDARGDQALILTCGHIFRHYRQGGRIDVELFGARQGETVKGHLLSFDDQRDIGLVMIETPGPVATVSVASKDYKIGLGDAVANVGCNHGSNPTVRRNQVTALDRYMGPPNIEVGGLPVEGRSGGGLFSRDGYVIGVCNAADPEENKGFYAALASIHHQLDTANLGFVYNEQKTSPIRTAPMVAVSNPTMPKTMPEPDSMIQLTESREPVSATAAATLPLTVDEQRLLTELHRRRSQGAEIVCVIRTKGNPTAKSEVFLFENASPQLVQRLQAEGFARR